MYLINIKTLDLEEFIEGSIPPYAILSHRWGSEELKFWETPKQRLIQQHKEGYRKLVKACEVAAKYSVNYLWIDTCCIDKKSSAELSEAINSMFTWYENAKICLAYLNDVKAEPGWEDSFKRSVWFTRSWTLQELLAPQYVDFLIGSEWVYLGSKDSKASMISEVTGIREEALLKKASLLKFTMAEKMSWAAERTATRSEDIAYSLMGIFDINMPLLYGEGRKAFTRLQAEIIRQTTDISILLWSNDNPDRSLLASTPADFRAARDRGSLECWPERLSLFALTNIGIEIECRLCRWQLDTYGLSVATDWEHIYVLLLRKPRFHSWSEGLYRVGVGLQPLTDPYWPGMRRLVVLRGDRKPMVKEIPRLERAQDHGDIIDAGLETVGFGFDVLTEATLPILDITFERCSSFRGGHEPRIERTGSNRLVCEFPDARVPDIAKVICSVDNHHTLLIDLSFDFDSRPCALLYTHEEDRFVGQISESVESSHTLQTEYDVSEYEMINVSEEGTEKVTYLFRTGNDKRMYARLPEDLVPKQCPVWLEFSRPGIRSADSRFWGVTLSRSRSCDTDLSRSETISK